jgi:PAS domain S-box-containing protein
VATRGLGRPEAVASNSGATGCESGHAPSPVHGVDLNSFAPTDAAVYQRYWEEMPCYLSVHDRDFRIIDGNRRFRRDFGDRIGEYCYGVYKGRDEICPDCPVEATFKDGQNHPSEQLLTTAAGREVPVIVHTTPIRDAAGEVVAVMEMHTNIEEVKRLQTELHQSQERLAQLFEEVPCFMTVQGPDRIILHANRRFRETFGEGVGDLCYRVYKHREEQCLSCPMIDTFETGRSHDYEASVLSKSGEELNLLVTTAPLRNAQGEVEAVIEMGVDITQMRVLQDQLTSIGLLVGSISHGIKGLLTGLDGGIYMVNSGFDRDKPERVKKGWEMVQRNVDRIRSMVLDILYYAKDRELTVDDIDLAGMVDELRDGVEKKAREIGVGLRFDCSADLGRFEGDGQAIRAMLLNLLENSLDACRMDADKDEHVVEVKARRAEPWMVIEIADNGIGMDRETREKLFSLFFSSKGIKGTGLGLFISNKIVDKHGGTIDVESEPGKGTRFVVRIPLKARPSTRPDQQGDGLVGVAGAEN